MQEAQRDGFNYSTDTEKVKNTKLSAIMNHSLLEGHNATYDALLILIPENNQFKLHLKESLLIKGDKLDPIDILEVIIRNYSEF